MRRAGAVSSFASPFPPWMPSTMQPAFAASGETVFMLNSIAKVSHDTVPFSHVIFHRALLREFASLAGAVFMALFAIALTTQLVRLLGKAAGGSIPTDAVIAFLGFF